MNPDALLDLLQRFQAEGVEYGDSLERTPACYGLNPSDLRSTEQFLAVFS